MEMQELISRGRMLLAGAPKRLEVFKCINGRMNAKEIAIKAGKPLVPTLNDIQKMRDLGLIQQKVDSSGRATKKDKYVVYEKVPELRHVSISYFKGFSKPVKPRTVTQLTKRSQKTKLPYLSFLNENQIVDIARGGEDEIHEFKSDGIDTKHLTKELAAFMHMRRGGIILYGVGDDGKIIGTSKSKQELDQSIHNSIRSSVDPSPPPIKLNDVIVLGRRIIVIVAPPWNKEEVYQYDGRVYVRKGTSVMVASPNEVRKLHRGEYID